MISYASRCLSRAKQNYSTTRRELLAVIFGLKQFRKFILWRSFLLRVDHSAINSRDSGPNSEIVGVYRRLQISDRSSGRIGPWQLWCLIKKTSCQDLRHEQRILQTGPEQCLQTNRYCCGTTGGWRIAVIYKAVRVSQNRMTATDVQSASEETRALWGQYKSLVICNGVLYREFYRQDASVDWLQIVMPPKLRHQFLKQLHEASENVNHHLGIRKTEAHVCQRAYWPNWRSDVEQYPYSTVSHDAMGRCSSTNQMVLVIGCTSIWQDLIRPVVKGPSTSSQPSTRTPDFFWHCHCKTSWQWLLLTHWLREFYFHSVVSKLPSRIGVQNFVTNCLLKYIHVSEYRSWTQQHIAPRQMAESNESTV